MPVLVGPARQFQVSYQHAASESAEKTEEMGAEIGVFPFRPKESKQSGAGP